MDATLDTTNMWLAIMAIVSVLEALVLIGLAVGGFMVYRRVMQTIADLESRHVAPVRARVETILGDVQTVTSRVSQETERVGDAINRTTERVDETAARMKHTVQDKVAHASGIVRGIRAAIVSILSSDAGPKPRAEATGH